MKLKNVFFALLCAGVFAPCASYAETKLDAPGYVYTVMQYTAKSAAQKPELKKRMQAIRDYIRTQPGYVENVLMENRNPAGKPDFVGVSRWKDLHDWERLWVKEDFQNLVRSVSEVGELNPGNYAPVK